MTRYLLYIGYYGTNFRGVQKQSLKNVPILDLSTVQGALEIALNNLKFRFINQPRVFFSSRTDSGVHAFKSSAHVDLELNYSLNPDNLTKYLNVYLSRNNIDIRILSAHIVPGTFHARFDAISRTYLYRCAILNKDPISNNYLNDKFHLSPISEFNRCYFIKPQTDFNEELMFDCAKLFPGTHNFLSFMNRASKLPEDCSSIRTLYKFNVTKGQSLFANNYDQNIENYNFWDFVCQGSSFLYKQVRRMVGTVLTVAQGRISLAQVESMLNNPSPESWSPKILPAPAHGLYLINVEYKNEFLGGDQEEASTTATHRDNHHNH